MTTFDDLLSDLEGTGWYQNRMAWFLIGPLFFITPFAFLNQLFALHIPDHWCSPPPGYEPENFNLTMDQWKEMFIPTEIGPDFLPRPSRCEMYRLTEESLPNFLSGIYPGNHSLETVQCRDMNGWMYDQSEFYDTAVTENNWVCDLETRATDLYTIGNVGLIVGTAIFSLLADMKGRRMAFYAATAFMVVFQVVQIFVSHIYWLYVTFKVLSFAAMLPLFQSPLSISTEISSIKKRGFVIGYGCVTWALGNMALPLVGWLIARWKIIRAVCVLPCLLIYSTWTFTPESPRWLMTKQRIPEATKIMMKIARANKVDISESEVESRLARIGEESSKEKSLGYLSLFHSKPLALRTLYITVAFTASAFIYYQLMINIGNMAGNTFLNLFLLGLVEGPGCMIGVWLGDRIGRRWTHFGLLSSTAVGFFAIMWMVYYPNLSPVVTVICMIIKMNVSATFVVSYVQSMEVFPTCIRQSGIGFCTLISQTISIAGPYVIYLGATDLKLPYLAMFLIAGLGALAVSLLPETLGATLPETLDEASIFGKEHKFFSFLPHHSKKKDHHTGDEAEKESLYDWNPVMREVFDGSPEKNLNASIIKDLLAKHYSSLKEDQV